jgi:predicted metal-dependent TIM-barrel fold hydrolase
MVSRTTDDYLQMHKNGIVAIIEPSFWLGQPRTGLSSFKDYYNTLVGWERFRASQFGIQHYCTIGLNPREANNEYLAEQVMEILPLYASKERVVAIGEIGFDDQTLAEEKYFRLQLLLAQELNLPIQIHTPHRDKKHGTLRSMDIIEELGINPEMVVIDHNNEETVKEVLDRGYWCAFTIYPHTKMGNERLAQIVKQYGSERIIVDSAADWGISDPLAVPKTANLMRELNFSPHDINLVTYQNALTVFGMSGQFNQSDWINNQTKISTNIFNGNTILRGGQSSENIII